MLGEAAELLAGAGMSGDCTLVPLVGGANNRVYRATASGRTALLKAYFRHDGDARDRLGAEFGFCRHAWDQGVRTVPEPLAADAARQLGLYELVAGHPLASDSVGMDHVRQAAAFVVALNHPAGRAAAGHLPAASEAAFSVREHLQLVGDRLERLRQIPPASSIGARATRFLEDELAPVWTAAAEQVERTATRLCRTPDDVLDARERVLSPSDFGFHNALAGADGRVRFIDFEYAGWDDPAKLVCDFFCQLAIPAPRAAVSEFVATVASCVSRRRRLPAPVRAAVAGLSAQMVLHRVERLSRRGRGAPPIRACGRRRGTAAGQAAREGAADAALARPVAAGRGACGMSPTTTRDRRPDLDEVVRLAAVQQDRIDTLAATVERLEANLALERRRVDALRALTFGRGPDPLDTDGDVTRLPPPAYTRDRADQVFGAALRRVFEYLWGEGLQGSVLEFGTLYGYTARWLAELTAEFQLPSSLYLYDSFTGLPAIDSALDRDSYQVAARRVWLEGSMAVETATDARIAAALSEVLPADRVHVVRGYFEETVPAALPRDAAMLVHVDCDLYASARHVLDALLERDLLQDGAVLLFDDYNCNRANPSMGERRALTDAFGAQSRFACTPWFSYGWHAQAFFVHDREAAPAADAGTEER